jgi:hypothetical protein
LSLHGHWLFWRARSRGSCFEVLTGRVRVCHRRDRRSLRMRRGGRGILLLIGGSFVPRFCCIRRAFSWAASIRLCLMGGRTKFIRQIPMEIWCWRWQR